MDRSDSERSITVTEDDDDDGDIGATPGITLDLAEDDQAYKFEDHYKLEDRIAEGSFGQVYAAQHLVSTRHYAVKVINWSQLDDAKKDLVSREVSILKICRDMEYIVRLVDYYASPEKLYLVQLYAEGGDVFSRLAQKTQFNEKDARDLAYQLLVAVRSLHKKRIAHRDLKPENLLLKSLLHDSEVGHSIEESPFLAFLVYSHYRSSHFIDSCG